MCVCVCACMMIRRCDESGDGGGRGGGYYLFTCLFDQLVSRWTPICLYEVGDPVTLSCVVCVCVLCESD
jgi:hypothetical protein